MPRVTVEFDKSELVYTRDALVGMMEKTEEFRRLLVEKDADTSVTDFALVIYNSSLGKLNRACDEAGFTVRLPYYMEKRP